MTLPFESLMERWFLRLLILKRNDLPSLYLYSVRPVKSLWPVHSWKADPGEVMTGENLSIYYNLPHSYIFRWAESLWSESALHRQGTEGGLTKLRAIHTRTLVCTYNCVVSLPFAFIYIPKTYRCTLRICKYEICVSNTLWESLEIWESKIGLQYFDMVIM